MHQKGCSKPVSDYLISRNKNGTKYRITDDPTKLSIDDWSNVVAAFVTGQEWQFKGWKLGGNPAHIFNKSEFYFF